MKFPCTPESKKKNKKERKLLYNQRGFLLWKNWQGRKKKLFSGYYSWLLWATVQLSCQQTSSQFVVQAHSSATYQLWHPVSPCFFCLEPNTELSNSWSPSEQTSECLWFLQWTPDGANKPSTAMSQSYLQISWFKTNWKSVYIHDFR